MTTFKRSNTYYRTKCKVHYLTTLHKKIPHMMHQIQFHIVQLPTSQLHLTPMNTTKLKKNVNEAQFRV